MSSARFGVLCGLVSIVLGLCGCSGLDSGDRSADISAGDARATTAPRAPVPLDEVRDAFAAAKAEDPSLHLAFFSCPVPPSSFEPPTLGTAAARASVDGGERSAPEDPALEGSALDDPTPGWISRVKAEIEPESWSLPGRRIFREGDYLVVFQSEEIARRIGPWIEARVDEYWYALPLVETEVRILRTVESPEGLLARIGVTFPDGASSMPLDDATVARLLTDDAIEVISAPRIASFVGQRAHCVVLSQQAYVSEFDVYSVDGTTYADPIVAILNEGVVVDLTTRQQPDETLRVDTVVNLAKVDAIEFVERAVRLGGDEIEPRILQYERPIVSSQQVESRLRVASEGTVLVRSAPGTASDGGETWILVRSRAVPRSDERR